MCAAGGGVRRLPWGDPFGIGDSESIFYTRRWPFSFPASGISHVFARSGYSVVLCDVEQRFLERGIATITKNLDREVAKNKISAEGKAAALKKIEPVTDRAKLADCDFIVEAATEKLEIKTEIFRDLDR